VGGRSAPFAIGIWALTAVLLTAAVVFGRGVFAQLPEEHLAQKHLTAQRQLRQLVLLILGEIALVSPSLQLSKPVRETIYLSFVSRGGDAFIPAKASVAILPPNGGELGQVLCRIFRLLHHQLLRIDTLWLLHHHQLVRIDAQHFR
jgi:hypothetical protein